MRILPFQNLLHHGLHRFIRYALVTGFVIYGARASAEGAQLSCREKPTSEARITSLAGDLFARGERAYADQQYSKALKRFLCSLYTFEHEATLTNIKEVIKFVEPKTLAAALLEDFATLSPDGEFTEELQEIARTIRLEAEQAAAPPAPPPVEEPAEVPPPPPVKVCITATDPSAFVVQAETEHKLFKILSAATLGVGAATLVTGGIFEGLSLAVNSDFQTGAVVGLAAGTLVTAVGVAGFVLALKKQKQWADQKAAPKTKTECKTAPAGKAEARLEPGAGYLRISLRF